MDDDESIAGRGAPSEDDRVALDLAIRGFQVSCLLRLVADLGIADHIPKTQPVAVEDLAAACGVQALPLMRVLRALCACGIFAVGPDGDVRHNPRSLLLRTDMPGSLAHAARFWAAPGSWAAWGKLDVAMTGGTPHVAAWNQGRFEYLRAHPDEARAFDAMMANFGDDRHAAVAGAYPFPSGALVADVGGGNGAALRQILLRHPTVRGLLFDRPDVVAALGPDQLMDGRIRAVGGSFFEPLPSGADVYILMRVLHDWPDADCIAILERCRDAMPEQGVLLICDQILQPDPSRAPPTEYLVDIQMMAMFGDGRERTEREFAQLVTGAGLTMRRVVPTGSAVQIVEAGR